MFHSQENFLWDKYIAEKRIKKKQYIFRNFHFFVFVCPLQEKKTQWDQKKIHLQNAGPAATVFHNDQNEFH